MIATIFLNIITLCGYSIFKLVRKIDKIDIEFKIYKEFSTKQKDRIENKLDSLIDFLIRKGSK